MTSPATVRLHAAGVGTLMTPKAVIHGRNINVVVMFMCQVVHSLTFIGIALYLPLIREDLSISYTQAGILSAAATLSYALGQIPAGFLADRLGPRRLFFVGLMGWSLLSMALGLIHSFWLAVLNLFVAGAFRALLFAPGLSLLASWFPRERGATAMSLYMLGAFAGNIVLALIAPALALALGWRHAFMLFALTGVLAAVGFFMLGGERPRQHGAQKLALREALQLCRHKILWVCGALQMIRFAAVTGFCMWLPSVLVADRGFTLQAAGVAVALSAALAAVANPLGGYLSDRLKNPPLVIGASLTVLAGACVLLTWVQSSAAVLSVVAVGSMFMQIYFGPLYHVPVEIAGRRAAGTVVGFSNLFANLSGLVTAYALGAVKDHTGSFSAGYLGIAVLCVIGVGLSVALARLRRRELRRMGAHAQAV